MRPGDGLANWFQGSPFHVSPQKIDQLAGRVPGFIHPSQPRLIQPPVPPPRGPEDAKVSRGADNVSPVPVPGA
jgi:hypothetical protein